MIVSTASSGSGMVSLQTDHQKVALQLARKLGNHAFPGLRPRSLLEYLIGHIDEGWSQVDLEATIDQDTGLPCDFRKLPFETTSQAWSLTIDHLATYNLFCGYLASLYFCQKLKDSPEPLLTACQKQFINTEQSRQEKLKLEFRRNVLTAQYSDSAFLEVCLNQILTLDKLAVALMSRYDDLQSLNVIDKNSSHHLVQLEQVSDTTYKISPFPFIGEKFEVCVRRFIFPNLIGQTKLNYRNILPELQQHIDTIQIVR